MRGCGILLSVGGTGGARWRDIDFPGQAIRVRANYSYGQLVTPKSGKVRTVPMVPDVAAALARIGQREHLTGDQDPVFVGPGGGHPDASRALAHPDDGALLTCQEPGQ